ncbi:MAG TPA: hypothetical protein VMJ31_11105 [Methylocystis sp.]|nr:hypothetical protein [Methylocystis sp.]
MLTAEHGKASGSALCDVFLISDRDRRRGVGVVTTPTVAAALVKFASLSVDGRL